MGIHSPAHSQLSHTIKPKVGREKRSGASFRMRKLQSPNECMASAATGNGCITSIASKGNLVYVGSHSGAILIYERATDGFVEIAQIECNAPVKALAIDENRVFGGLQDSKLKVWSHQFSDKSLKLLTNLPTVEDRIVRSIKPGSYVKTRRHHRRLWIRHADAVSCLSLSLEDGVMYSGSWDKTVKVWRLSDFKCVESIGAHEDAVNDICCARKGGILFTASADGTVRVWRTDHRDHRSVLVSTLGECREDAVNCMELSPDESILYSGTSGGQINNWTMDSTLQTFKKRSFSAHKRPLLCLTTLNNFVMSGSADSTIRVWRRSAETAHACVAVMEGHGGPVKCITAALPSCVSPDSSSNFSSSHSSSSSSSSASCSSRRNESCSRGCHSYGSLRCSGFVVYSGSVDGTLKMWWVNGDNDCSLCAPSPAQTGRPF